MERQILMQNQMRERQMAMQIAWSREFLKYFGSFFTVATLGLTAGWEVEPPHCLQSERKILGDDEYKTRCQNCEHIASVCLFILRAIKRKNPGMLAPIVPLGFIFAYQMDSAYGTLIYRMRGEAIWM